MVDTKISLFVSLCILYDESKFINTAGRMIHETKIKRVNFWSK